MRIYHKDNGNSQVILLNEHGDIYKAMLMQAITPVPIFSDPSPYPGGTESPFAMSPASPLHFEEIITQCLREV